MIKENKLINGNAKRKFTKGETLSIKPGYYYLWNTWALEKGMANQQKPLYVTEKIICKFVKNSPEGPSFKILELPTGEQIEVLTAHIK